MIKSKRRKNCFSAFIHASTNPFYLWMRKKTNKNEQIRGDDVFLILVLFVLCNKRSYRHNVPRMSVVCGWMRKKRPMKYSILYRFVFMFVSPLPERSFMSTKISRPRYVPLPVKRKDNGKKI